MTCRPAGRASRRKRKTLRPFTSTAASTRETPSSGASTALAAWSGVEGLTYSSRRQRKQSASSQTAASSRSSPLATPRQFGLRSPGRRRPRIASQHRRGSLLFTQKVRRASGLPSRPRFQSPESQAKKTSRSSFSRTESQRAQRQRKRFRR